MARPEHRARAKPREPAACVRVLVADRQVLFSTAVAGALRLRGDIEVLDSHPDTGLGAIRAADELKPEVMLVDHWIRGMQGPAVAGVVLGRSPGLKVIIISGFYNARDVDAALAAGVAGFVTKNSGIGDLAGAILAARSGTVPVLSADVAGLPRAPVARPVPLTEQEVRILELLGHFGTTRTIPDVLGIKPATLRTHLQNIYRKTGARTQSEAVAWARSSGTLGG